MASITKEVHQKELFGHPIGLYVLFFTEMWERFSYYGMRALLVLYMTAETLDSPQSGLGWLEGEALALYGWYTMLVYLMSIPGGFIADRIIGQKWAVTIGAILLTIGHGVLSIDALWAYYTGLGFVILGVGMLKPNISTMVGGLYKQNDIRRDKGFSIFYVGINLGSFLASLSVGLVAKEYGWHAGFGLAGIGMFFGLIVYLIGQFLFLPHVGNPPTAAEKASDISIGSLFAQLLRSPLQLGIVGLLLAYSVYAGFTYEGSDHWGFGVLFIFISLITGIMMMIYKNLNGQVEKDRYIVLLLSLLIIIVFWGCFEQMGGLMNLYAEQKTDRMLLGWEVPAAWFQAANPCFIILFAVIIANIWAKRKLKGKEATSIFKMAVGVVIMGVGFMYMVFASMEYEANGSSAMYWLVLAYLFHTIGELCLSPVSLSFFTKLAPARYMALMMGVYWAATGLGNKVAGVIGESSAKAGELKVFGGLFIFAIVFGILVILLIKPLKRLTHGAEDKETIIHDDETEGFELSNH